MKEWLYAADDRLLAEKKYVPRGAEVNAPSCSVFKSVQLWYGVKYTANFHVVVLLGFINPSIPSKQEH